MSSIKWCKKQTKGISLTEPNINLCDDYYQSAEESMKVLRATYQTGSRMWLATTKYYVEYLAAYSLLMRLGIKCEIHDCTIAILHFLEQNKILPQGLAAQVEEDKQLRIDNQYYLKNLPVKIDFNTLTNFLLRIRERTNSLTDEEISTIQQKISQS